MKWQTQDQIRELLEKAEDGDITAQVNLGLLYMQGHGVAKDAAKAVRWWRSAADHGNATAQFNLANSYRTGAGVPMDTAEARSWYRRAFDQGLGRAGANLGLMYANGEGCLKMMSRLTSCSA